MQARALLFYIFISVLFVFNACNDDKPCDGLDCGENGTCVIDKNFEPYCACLPGYYGEFCEFYDPCLLIECVNGGTKEIDTEDPTVCHCVCPPEYDGEFCELQNFCLNFTCENGGTPVNQPELSSCTCDCPPEFIGIFCETPNPCATVTCPTNATCQLTQTLEPDCVCNPGWEGNECETEIRDKYIGAYNAISYYPDGSSTAPYTCNITKHPDDVTKMYFSHLLVNNIGSNPIELKDVYGVVYQSNTFALPVQNVFPDNEQVKSVSIGQRNPSDGKITVYYTYEKNNETVLLQLALTPQ